MADEASRETIGAVGAASQDAMLLDELLPRFDATRIEHRVIKGEPRAVYEAVMAADFLQTWRDSTTLRLLFAARSSAERLVARARSREFVEPPTPPSLRLADMPTRGDWIRLGDAPPHEIAFGVIGRFWGGETIWEQIDATNFTSFARPRFAKIGCNFSLRPYGTSRTLLSYEARTQATDPDSRRAFLRYWNAVSAGVGVVMRAQLKSVEREAATASHAHPR
jgi:hypothetical protein